MLAQDRRPTAIFAANDLSALSIIETAREFGLDVPGDLSVIGFDDVPEASRATPGLTTVRQPMQRIGATAAEMLVALMSGRTPESTHLILPTRLVPRGTTAPPR